MKIEADNLNKISMSQLNKWDMLEGDRSSKITFSDSSTVDLDIRTHSCDDRLYLSYASEINGEEDIETRVRLTTTSCFWGGSRYWFLCPGINDNPCNNRVGILYRVGDEFACRECHDLTYMTKSATRKAYKVALRETGLFYKLEEMKKSIKRVRYAGKTTRKIEKLTAFYEKYKVAVKSSNDALNIKPEDPINKNINF